MLSSLFLHGVFANLVGRVVSIVEMGSWIRRNSGRRTRGTAGDASVDIITRPTSSTSPFAARLPTLLCIDPFCGSTLVLGLHGGPRGRS
jgi:hypothetical protein